MDGGKLLWTEESYGTGLFASLAGMQIAWLQVSLQLCQLS